MTYKTGNKWQEKHWNHPPPPFNPAYKPHAVDVWNSAVAECWRREGFGGLPREDRAREIAAEYDRRMADWEAKK